MAAFEGLKVVHLTRTFPTSYTAFLLAQQGADVVQVLEPGYLARRTAGDGRYYIPLLAMVDRGKRSLVVDLKREEGLEVVRALAGKADVFIEGFRPGTAERLGVGHQALRSDHPALIYAALSGYGHDGPYARRAGHDLNCLGVAGALEIVEGDARALPLPVADLAGAVHLALAISFAVLEQSRSGQGTFIDMAMADAVASWMILPLSRELAGLPSLTGVGPGLAETAGGPAPYRTVYECLDGKYLTISCTEPWLWDALCALVGHQQFAALQGDVTSWQHIRDTLKGLFLLRARSDWLARLDGAGIPCAPVNDLRQMLEDPQLAHRGVFRTGSGEGTPVLGDIHSSTRQAGESPSAVVEDPRGVLMELGYAVEVIERLLADGVVQ
jgi:crotonobetainyl-CoA:carnitine CoA-transferase CaiB-like acyl-CoA transferase